MTRDFSVIIERDAEGYYVGSVPALRGCHSQARSLDELMDRIREAIEVCLEAQGGSLEPLDFVGIQTISVAS
jgi:predicted RNase H-like HicB family nuclease